jgi:AcrR family transcriptional regulator
MNREELTTKMQIVNTAIGFFKQHGFHEISVTQICNAVGITRSAFYYYFKTKDEIFDYYLLMPELYIMENVLPILEASSYRAEFFKLFKLFSSRVVEIGPEIVRFVIKRNIESKIHTMAPHDITMWQVYVDLIQKAQNAGEINNKIDAESIVEIIIHMINGIACTWCNQNAAFDYAEKCQKTMELIL